MKKKSLILLIAIIILSPISVYAYCPLGEDVTKDLSGVLKIMQIAAPVMCIGFSVYEVIKTLAKFDASADLKKVATRFGKRVLYTIILFFLPVLVDQVMQIADVWGADGTCDLNNPVSNEGTSASASTTEATTKATTQKSTASATNTTTTMNVDNDPCKAYAIDICANSNVEGGQCYWNIDAGGCTHR